MRAKFSNLHRISLAIKDLPASVFLIIYFAIMASLEIIGTYHSLFVSFTGHALLIVIFINHFMRTKNKDQAPVLLVLALLSFMRILSLVLPVSQISEIYWYPLIGIPLLLGVFLVTRHLALLPQRISFDVTNLKWRLLIALSGLPLSIIGYFILRPQPDLIQPVWWQGILAAMVLFLFVGFTEEILFRGLLLSQASKVNHNFGFFYSTALYFFMNIGSGSYLFTLFMGLVGVYFTWWVKRTNSLWEVVIAHGFLISGMALIWPILWS